ncbi:ubiquinol oxidase subunit II [Mangrovibacter sp. MFB070]|uniref:cytochrome d ubiquinol oxidase subunit II n=1 Tax=Mangrovibacter sp. MFB070 TaxID=1224318 RepID=UPI0004D6EBAF|nr:cytochrome d ubiquinol oxidase subunit II [Mangrovibacter sp. MFB070]KEA50997.1 ubiquinol oxidase subunit II [Mangrovibacter sp. MFB070]
MTMDLSLFWFALIIFATLMYIIMDGFDLGVGMLFAVEHTRSRRDVMVNTVAPVWDGNETWLVLGGAALFGAFPQAYAAITDYLAVPLTLMLLGLIFRGVAFEFRVNATHSHRAFWDKSFMLGSFVATFTQGMVAGALVQGFSGSSTSLFPWLTPFTVFCGVGLVVAWSLLGSTWLVLKCDGELALRMRHISILLLGLFLVILLGVSVFCPLTQPFIARRWFSLPGFWYLLPVPLLVGVCSFQLARTLRQNNTHRNPFIMAIMLVFLGFAGLGVSLWPFLLPPSMTLWDAAAPAASQRFMLPGALFILPVILGYTWWSYHVFRGKVTADGGYH